jgi:hypothetical protein
VTIQMSKFGTFLNGRPAAREAALCIQQIVNSFGEYDNIVFDFTNVTVLVPTYADELFRIMKEKYGPEKIKIINTSAAIDEIFRIIEKVAAEQKSPS